MFADKTATAFAAVMNVCLLVLASLFLAKVYRSMPSEDILTRALEKPIRQGVSRPKSIRLQRLQYQLRKRSHCLKVFGRQETHGTRSTLRRRGLQWTRVVRRWARTHRIVHLSIPPMFPDPQLMSMN